MVEARDRDGYARTISRMDKDGNLYDRNGYNIGRIRDEEKRLELKLAQLKEKNGEKSGRVFWIK